MRGKGTPRAGQRQDAERDATQPGSESRTDSEADRLEERERAPSFLSARELQAREPAKGQAQEGTSERTEKKPRSKGADAL